MSFKLTDHPIEVHSYMFSVHRSIKSSSYLPVTL
jgi:hypothetical protein